MTRDTTSTSPPCPYLQASPRHPHSRILGFAHRGGAKHPELTGLENSLRAFQHAFALGYDFLETDVHATRDGVLVAFHDEVLDRVTDQQGKIAELTASEVARARIGGSEPIPTMGELLRALPEARFNIDVKSAEAVRPLVDLIDAEKAHDRVLIGSFSGKRLRNFRRLSSGRVATSASPVEVAAFLLSPSARLAKLITRSAPVALQIPARSGRFQVASPGLIDRAHRAGVAVHVWTIDDETQMRELLNRGVDGLMTDRTDILRSVLSELGQWEEPQ